MAQVSIIVHRQPRTCIILAPRRDLAELRIFLTEVNQKLKILERNALGFPGEERQRLQERRPRWNTLAGSKAWVHLRATIRHTNKVARDLWSEAFTSLSREDREVLRLAGQR